MQVLRVCSFSAFSLPPAFPPCSCPLAFRHQVRRLTSRISSESHPGNQECVTNYHGAEEFTCVHHTAHPAPSPPDAGRDTVPSRFGCQSRDCGYLVREHLTARYLAAVPRRILLTEQQVWSKLPDNQPCDLVSQCFLLMAPFRTMLLIPRDGPWSLGPKVQGVPVYSLAFLHSYLPLSRRTNRMPEPPRLGFLAHISS